MILVEEIRTGIFGHGDTYLDAIEDFARAAREHLDVLERQDRLSPLLARQLAYLRARIPS